MNSQTDTNTGSMLTGAAQRNGIETKSQLGASRALFLLAAGASFVLSVSLWFIGSREQGLFVGLWVPSILSLGALLTNNKGGPQ